MELIQIQIESGRALAGGDGGGEPLELIPIICVGVASEFIE